MTFGKRLKKLREPLTQAEFAKKVSELAKEDGLPPVTQQFIAKLEADKVGKSAYYPYIAKAIGISQNELLQGSETKKYQPYSENKELLELIKNKLGDEDNKTFAKELGKLIKKAVIRN